MFIYSYFIFEIKVGSSMMKIIVLNEILPAAIACIKVLSKRNVKGEIICAWFFWKVYSLKSLESKLKCFSSCNAEKVYGDLASLNGIEAICEISTDPVQKQGE